MPRTRWKSLLSPEQQAHDAKDRAEHVAILVAQGLLKTKAELSAETLAALQAKLERWMSTGRASRRAVP